jgi:hypothetical protein
MEYLFGSLITLTSLYACIRFFLKEDSGIKNKRIVYSQSHIFEILKPLLPDTKYLKHKKIKRQSQIYDEKVNVKVIIAGNEAYWIKNNLFYVADIKDNYIDKDSARVVDTIHMDKVQLDKMLFIMDQLRDGKENDSWNSGN